jgi:hypothetical protein
MIASALASGRRSRWCCQALRTAGTGSPCRASDAVAQVDAPCLLIVDQPRDQRVGHRLVGRENVRSFYQSGLRSERNPDYDAAQLRLRQAERAAKEDGIGILKVGDPMLDLFGTMIDGFISGFREGSGERKVDEAMSELIATPRSRDRPTYRAYQFERMTVLAGKEATIPIALLDRASGRVWRTELRQRERRELAIVEGLDPRDRDYEAHSAASLTRDEFEQWLGEPPRLQLSAIAAALREAAPVSAPDRPMVAASAAPPVDLATARPATASAAPTLAASAGRSVDIAAPAAALETPTLAGSAGSTVDLAAIEPGSGPQPISLVAPPGAAANTRPSSANEMQNPLPVAHERLASTAARAPLVLDRAGGDRHAALGASPRPVGQVATEPPPAQPASPGASVVRVLAEERSGGGVYVSEDLVLTTAQLVGRASVVDVAAADGTRVLGLVARADGATNLALVQVSRPGTPAALYGGPPVAGGTTVQAIVPTVGGNLVRASGRYLGNGPAPRLASPMAADLAHIDAPSLNDAPQAIPWFLGDRLVGLGLDAAAGRSDGRYHAIGAADIDKFLDSAGALAALR